MSIRSKAFHQPAKTLRYPYYFVTADYAAEAVGDLLTSDFYARDTRAMRAVESLQSLHRVSTSGSHNSKMTTVKRDAEEVVDVFIDDGTTWKKEFVRDSNL